MWRFWLSVLIRRLHPWAPRGLILDTAAWARQWSSRHSVNRAQAPAVFTLRRAEAFVRQADAFDARAATPEEVMLAIDRAKFCSQYAGPVDLYVIAQGRVCGPDGMLLAPDGRLLAELNDNGGRPGDNPLFRRRRFCRQPLRLSGNVLSLVQPLSGNHFHWLTEGLALLARLQPFLAGIDHVLVPERLSDQQRESLRLAGIAPERQVPLAAAGMVVCERLYGLTFRSGWLLAQQEAQWLRQRFLGSEPSPPAPPPSPTPTGAGGRRIYISRADAGSRRVRNEAAVLEVLEAYGFEVVRCSELTCVEQAQRFHAADMIVALHGAALTNLLFCRAGTQVLEIFPPRWSPLCFFGLSRLAGCRYAFLTASPSGASVAQLEQERRHVPTSTQAQWADVTVPLDRLRTYLDGAAGPPS